MSNTPVSPRLAISPSLEQSRVAAKEFRKRSNFRHKYPLKLWPFSLNSTLSPRQAGLYLVWEIQRHRAYALRYSSERRCAANGTNPSKDLNRIHIDAPLAGFLLPGFQTLQGRFKDIMQELAAPGF